VENAVDLAVAQQGDLGGGYTLKVINYDDEFATGDGEDPARGASNVRSMVRDACVVGMVGPYTSEVAQAEMPIAARAGLAMISPTNTNPGLTLRPYAAEDLDVPFDQLHPAGTKTNYFRDVANDAFQGAADADFTFDSLAAHRVYVVVSLPSLGTWKYDEDLVGGFTKEFLTKGGTILATESLEWHDPDAFAPLAARIAAAAPDAVYFGGEVQGGAALLKGELLRHGYTGPYVGGDGIALDPTFIEQAGADASRNTFASIAEPDIATFAAGPAATFLSDYRARYPGQPVDGSCAQGYDAAMVLITAIKNLILAGRDVTREAVIDQVQNVSYTGVSGVIAFDRNGDDVHGVYTIYTVQHGQWGAYSHVSV
jgi:branched-chain amino acid transport system substrate-binding protein